MYTLLHSRKNSVKSCFSLSFYSLCDLWYSFHCMVLMFSFFNCDLPKILFFFFRFMFYILHGPSKTKQNEFTGAEQQHWSDIHGDHVSSDFCVYSGKTRRFDLNWKRKHLSFFHWPEGSRLEKLNKNLPQKNKTMPFSDGNHMKGFDAMRLLTELFGEIN